MTGPSPRVPEIAVLPLPSGGGPDVPRAPLGGLSRRSGAGGESFPPHAETCA